MESNNIKSLLGLIFSGAVSIISFIFGVFLLFTLFSNSKSAQPNDPQGITQGIGQLATMVAQGWAVLAFIIASTSLFIFIFLIKSNKKISDSHN